VGEGAEEGVSFELAAGLARGGEAGQEVGEGSRAGQGLGQVRGLPPEAHRLAQGSFVEVDGSRREELRGLAAVPAPGAVAAGMGKQLSEVGREEGRLATVVGGEGQHLVEAGDLAALPFEGALVERSRYLLQIGGPAEPAVGMAQAGGADFQQVLLGQVVESPHQAVTGSAQSERRRFEVEGDQTLASRLPEDATQELPSLLREAV